MKRKPLTELEAVAVRDAQANAEAYFKLRDELDAAEDEMEALRDELNVTRDLLRSIPPHFAAPWYEDICDYLETAG